MILHEICISDGVMVRVILFFGKFPGKCGDDILIFVSIDDGQISTQLGEVTSSWLNQVKKLHETSRILFQDDIETAEKTVASYLKTGEIYTALSTLISMYNYRLGGKSNDRFDPAFNNYSDLGMTLVGMILVIVVGCVLVGFVAFCLYGTVKNRGRDKHGYDLTEMSYRSARDVGE